MNISENVVGTLRAQDHGHPPVVLVGIPCAECHEKALTAYGFKPRQSSAGGLGFEKDKAPTLVADGEFCQGGVLVIMESVSADGTEKVLRPA